MKKFYTLALAAIVAATASAKSFEVKQFAGCAKAHSIAGAQFSEKVSGTTTRMVKVKASTDAAATAIEGDYKITIGDLYFSSSIGEFTQDATITREGNKITISSDYFVTDVTADYDEATGALTFNSGAVGTFSQSSVTYYYQFRPFGYDDAQDDPIVYGSYSATYADGAIEFPADHGFAWPCFTDAAMTTSAGYLDLFDVLGIETVANFTTYTDCDWTENLLYGVLTDKGENTTVAKTAVVYNKILKTYEIADAYQATYAAIGKTASSPALFVDASEEGNCLVDLQTSAISNTTNGTYYIFSESWNMDDPSKLDEALRITCVEDEKAITITFPVKSVALYTSKTQKFYYASPYVSKLVITKANAGVSDIVVDEDSNAPVEYYNLQGVRLAEPAAGQLVIRRQGNKATKLLVK